MPPKIATLEPDAPPKSNALLLKTTIGDHGNTLPLGLFDLNHGHIRDFEFNPPVMRVKKKLGAVKIRKDLEKMPGKLVSYWLAEALKTLGPWDMNEMDLELGAQKVAALSFGDVLYLLLRWGLLEDEKGLKLPGDACGACNQNFESIRILPESIDLDVLPDVDTDGNSWSSTNTPAVVVRLEKGIPVGKATAYTLLLKPPAWIDSFWKLSAGAFGNQALRVYYLMRSSVIANDASERPVHDDGIDELYPVDTDLMSHALGLITPTPHMQVDITCPRCKAINRVLIPWDSPGFFI